MKRFSFQIETAYRSRERNDLWWHRRKGEVMAGAMPEMASRDADAGSMPRARAVFGYGSRRARRF
jgi:hypothetical protein